MNDEPKMNKPMDPNVPYTDNPVNKNRQRTCYAIQTLVAEVDALFPDVPTESSNYDGRNTALDVTFDLTPHDDAERAYLRALLGMIQRDPRVQEVIYDDTLVLVSMHSNPVTQDSREPFGLDDAYEILIEGGESL